MENYKTKIDGFIDELEKEYESCHEQTTKAINYEYIAGKLYGLYDIAKENLGLDAFIELHEYRKKELDEISVKFNYNILNPLYNTVRLATSSESNRTINKRNELAKRVYDIDVYENRNNDTTPDDIAKSIKSNPLETIAYLLDIIDDLTA